MYGPGSCKVAIFGEYYTIRTDASNELIVQAATLVDSMMKEIAHTGTLDTKSIAVLTALRFAYQVNATQDASMAVQAHENLCKLIDLELEKLGIKL